MKLLKNQIFATLTLSLITVSASIAQGYSASRPPMGAAYKTGVYTNASGKLCIGLDKEAGGTVRVTLSTNRVGLYDYVVGKKETTNRSCLNLNNLPDGAYDLKITNGVETTWHTIRLSSRPPMTHNRLIVVN